MRQLSLISKFMTPETWKQMIKIHILPSISRSKDNQAMKFRQLIEYKVRNSFVQKSVKGDVGRLVPDIFVFFKETL